MEARGDRSRMAEAARRRARVYEMLVMVFGRVPDADLIGRMQSAEFRGLVQAFGRAGSKELKKSAVLIDTYLTGAAGREEAAVVEELSVDRTLLVRAPGESGLKAPYEGLYQKEKSKGGAPLAVKTFYRRAGLLPGEAVNESPDFLGLELDFMKHLCQREADRWETSGEAAETIGLEHEFLTKHLGSWIGEYCRLAAALAKTDFFRGCLGLLAAVTAGEAEFLRELAGASSGG